MAPSVVAEVLVILWANTVTLILSETTKAVMHPVDFVVFNGLNEGEEVRDVTFLTGTPYPHHETIEAVR